METALKKSLLFFGTVVVVVVATLIFATSYHQYRAKRVSFSLIDTNRQSVTQETLGGKHMVVFFGFTHCPDICPTQMYKVSRLMDHLQQEGIDSKITPVFISVDPERDTPERIKSYLTQFHYKIIGLTGSRPQLARTTESFSTLLQDAPEAGDENYMVAHSALYYLIDPFGRIIDHIPSSADVQDMVETVGKYL